MMTTANERVTLAVFGASGQTGKCVVQNALERGWKVKAQVRSPDKFELEHENLTVIQGDFKDAAAIKETVQGAKYVICTAGGPHSNFKYEKGFMGEFVREQLWPALEESRPEAFLFQAGALSKTYRFLPTFGQLFVAPLLGLWPMAKDNDAVMHFIHKNPLQATRVTVTRPGALMSGAGGSELRTSCTSAMMPITFADLGKFNVDAVTDESLAGKYPYIALKNGF